MIDARGKRNIRHGKQSVVVNNPNTQGASLFEEVSSSRPTKGYKSSKSSRPVARELEVEKEKEVLKGYQRVMDLTPAMKAGDEVGVKEWLLEAEKLIETFRETRRLFLSTRVSDPYFVPWPPLSCWISLSDFKGCSKPNVTPKRMRTIWRRDYRLRWVSPSARHKFSPTSVLDREKGAGSRRSQNLVDVFRGVSFDDWLQLTMEVINPFSSSLTRALTDPWVLVLVFVDPP